MNVILVVEDDVGLWEVLIDIFEMLGIDCIVVDSVE